MPYQHPAQRLLLHSCPCCRHTGPLVQRDAFISSHWHGDSCEQNGDEKTLTNPTNRRFLLLQLKLLPEATDFLILATSRFPVFLLFLLKVLKLQFSSLTDYGDVYLSFS